MGMQEYYDFFSDIKSFNEMKLTLNGKKFEWTERTAKLFDFLLLNYVERQLRFSINFFTGDINFSTDNKLQHKVLILMNEYLDLIDMPEIGMSGWSYSKKNKAISIMRKDLDTLLCLNLNLKTPCKTKCMKIFSEFIIEDVDNITVEFTPIFVKLILQISELGSEFRHSDFKI